MPETLSPKALCSDADLFSLVKPNEAPTAEETDLAIRLVNAASSTIYDLTGKEYVKGAAGEARLFEASDLYDYGLGLELELGQAAVIESVELVRVDGSSEACTFLELPFGRKPDEPITGVRLLFGSPQARSNDQAVRVTGTFGYPERPERVRQAAALTAAAWYTRDVSRFSEAFVQVEGGRPAEPRALPAEAFDLIRMDAGPHIG